MKNPFIKTLTPTEKAVQVARELLTTIERVAEIGDLNTSSELWGILSAFSNNQKTLNAE
jgi:hypothetical protein